MKVLEGAQVSNGGSGAVANGGDGTTVKVGNDSEYETNTVSNPVPDDPVKAEKPAEGKEAGGALKVGDEITYEISFANYKTEPATVTVKDKLDKNVAYVSADNGGVYDETAHTVTWTINNVPAGDKGKVSLTVKVLEGAQVSNGGTGAVANGGDGTTVKVGNDSEYETNTVSNPVPDDTISLTVIKIWDDNNNAYGLRPRALTVRLYNNSEVRPIHVVTLNAANGWQATVSGLPIYNSDGTLATYRWVEAEVAGYTSSVAIRTDGTAIFTNRYRPRPVVPGTPETPPAPTPNPPIELEDYGTPLGIDVEINNVGDTFD